MLAPPSLLPLFGIIPILWLGNWWFTGRPWPRTPLNGSLYVMLLMIGVSVWATPDLLLSLEKVVGLTFSILLFWVAVAVFGRSQPHFLAGLVIFWGLSLGIVGVALLKTTWTAKIPGLGAPVALLNRLNALAAGIPLPQINANQVAGVLMWVTPLFIIVTWAMIEARRKPAAHPPEWVRFSRFYFLIGSGAAVFLLTLVLTQSRSGWLAFGLAVPVMGWLAGGWLRRMSAMGVLLVVIGITLFFAVDPGGTGQEQVMRALGLRSDALVQEEAIGTLNGRMEIWSRAVYGLQDFPFTGMGMNTFREVVHVLYPMFLISPTIDIAHAHNHLLQTGLDLGIPGLVAYLALWLGAVWLLRETWRTSDHNRLIRLLVIGFCGSLTAYWLYGLTDTVALGAKPGFLWWILLALIVTLHKLSGRSPES